MMGLALYGLPILIGFILGYFLVLPINIAIGAAAALFAIYALWATKDAELGSMIGVIVAIEVAIFEAAMWITTAFVYGASINPHWIVRP